MVDIVPALLEAIENDFKRLFEESSTIKAIKKLIAKGAATYAEANAFAAETGRLLVQAFKKNLSSAVLPEGKMYFNIAERILGSTLGDNHKLIASTAAKIQEDLNKAAGIGIKAVEIKLDKDKIKGFVDRISAEPMYDDVAWILDKPVINNSLSIVDATIKANAELHARVGLSPKIVRTPSGGACEWCRAVAGTYAYPDVPDDVYRRHDNCYCSVDYNPGDGKSQNVHSKRWV